MKALILNKVDDEVKPLITEVDESQLPDGDVSIDVEYSSLNYKDSLAVAGFLPSIRSFPMVPGIDMAGTVTLSAHPSYKSGDKVVLNGWGVGETHWGGYAQKARVKGDWLVPIPDVFSTKQAMAIGTAGYTAMLCVMALQRNGVSPDQGEVLVTGAAGGVGSVAISVLAKLGYTVVASTGRAEEEAYLKSLGASSIINRADLSEPGKPMTKERWAGAVDTVGSHTLANICAGLKYDGTVAATGMAQGRDLPATVMPFILRSVTLAGVDSVMAPRERRMEAWSRLADELDLKHLDSMTEEIALEDIPEAVALQLKGAKTRGRTVVNVNR
ncbi:MDR family oxidoreductase [Kordiimonas sp. SCSIO 12610]|uniref:acrylyl-CoA reductase (NADPH) n=1 Tax=Kordiimonas sp. SCSIO 12610 TaxID=2829597 RepID=UPI0021095B3B|nr:MDR family oxidoreductase [Kordiimonas sp. SCSIO 12610]UTW53983.1 oxidoreductase [Kordiimonas sp. SCSIO 12610]